MADTSQFDCEVLIVGGGPAGSACGGMLRRAGIDVAIMDRAAFPRDKVCAGWITPPVIEELALDLDDYRRRHVLQPIGGFRTGILGGPLIETRYDQTVSYAIRRCEFDGYLLERSEARTLQETPFHQAERIENGWLVNGRIRTRLLIGAGGHFCPVSRMINAHSESSRDVIAAQEVEFALDDETRCAVVPEVPELYFFADLRGYAWCVRKGRYLNIGLGRDHEATLTRYRDQLLTYLVETGRIAAPPQHPFRGHAYRIYRNPQRRVVDDRLLLIGDAAGLAVPQSGEGIRPAVESGLLAAAVVREAGGDYSADSLAVYNRRLARQFGQREKPFAAGNHLLARLRIAAAQQLLRTRWFTRHVLLDRWFLQRHQSAMVEAS